MERCKGCRKKIPPEEFVLAGGEPCLRALLRQAGVEIFYEQAPLQKRDKLSKPLQLSSLQARNFVLCILTRFRLHQIER